VPKKRGSPREAVLWTQRKLGGRPDAVPREGREVRGSEQGRQLYDNLCHREGRSKTNPRSRARKQVGAAAGLRLVLAKEDKLRSKRPLSTGFSEKRP
jgi:hypothetical protein